MSWALASDNDNGTAQGMPLFPGESRKDVLDTFIFKL